MAELTHLDPAASVDTVVDAVTADGAVIVEGLLDDAGIARFRSELDPHMEATAVGQDDFSGRSTTRTGALVARSAQAREMVVHPLVLEAATRFLTPYCERIQLHLTQIIRLRPGQGAQMIHRDRWAWGRHLRGVEPQFNTIWAITDFTTDNGATRVVPGSTDWPDGRRAEDHEICQAVMPAGSVLLYSGSVFHGGGENRSDGDRIAANLTYTLGWLRQEENQYLSCPPEVAAGLDPELQALLGYEMGQYALGYYSPPGPPGTGPECVSPAHAVRGDDAGTAALGGQDLLTRAAARPSPAP